MSKSLGLMYDLVDYWCEPMIWMREKERERVREKTKERDREKERVIHTSERHAYVLT